MRAFLPLIIVFFGLLGPLGVAAQVPQSQREIMLSFSPVVKKSAPGVVNIYARKVVPGRASPFAADPFFSRLFEGFGQAAPRVQNSLGSGVILSSDGIVVSNYHVVGEATSIRVVLADRREFDAEVVLADEANDLAVLRLNGASDLPALEFSNSDDVEVGDLILAIGNPFGVGQTVTSGIISGLARSGIMSSSRAAYFIQTDAPINPGNSGGALVDLNGRLVGINTSILTRSGGSNGIGFAIPANLVRTYVEQARAGNTRLVRPWSGINGQAVDGTIAEAMGLDYPRGLAILEAHPSSPFARAGLGRGDVLLSIDGEPVNAQEELEYRLTTTGVGKRAEVAYLRDGKQKTARVDLAEAPEDPPREIREVGARSPLHGLQVANINPAVIDELQLSLSARGVVVLSPGQAGLRVGLHRGDIIAAINGKQVRNSDDVKRLMRSRTANWSIAIDRAGQRGVIRFRS